MIAKNRVTAQVYALEKVRRNVYSLCGVQECDVSRIGLNQPKASTLIHNKRVIDRGGIGKEPDLPWWFDAKVDLGLDSSLSRKRKAVSASQGVHNFVMENAGDELLKPEISEPSSHQQREENSQKTAALQGTECEALSVSLNPEEIMMSLKTQYQESLYLSKVWWHSALCSPASNFKRPL